MNKKQKEYVVLKTILTDGKPPNYRDAETCTSCKYSKYDKGCKCGGCGYSSRTCTLFGIKVQDDHLCDGFENDYE